MTHDEALKAVIEGLTTLILAYHSRYASDYRGEGYDQDRIEENMKENKSKVVALRKMRTQFENILTGAPL